jgi:hypothetical protein
MKTHAIAWHCGVVRALLHGLPANTALRGTFVEKNKENRSSLAALHHIAAAALVTLPFLMGACSFNPLQGKGLKLWGDDDDPAPASQHQQAGGKTATHPNGGGDGHSGGSQPCKLDKSLTQLDESNSAVLKDLSAEISKFETENPLLNRDDFYQIVRKYATEEAKLGLTAAQIKSLTKLLLARSHPTTARTSATAVSNAPAPAPAPAPTTTVAASPAAHPLHETISAWIAYQHVISFTQNDKGLGIHDASEAAKGAGIFLSQSPDDPAAAFAAACDVYDLYADPTQKGAKDEASARKFLTQVLSDKRYDNSYQALIVWLNKFRLSSRDALDDDDLRAAAVDADKAICIDTSRPAQDGDHSKKPTAK